MCESINWLENYIIFKREYGSANNRIGRWPTQQPHSGRQDRWRSGWGEDVGWGEGLNDGWITDSIRIREKAHRSLKFAQHASRNAITIK